MPANPDSTRLSKFLSLVLRHEPERAGLQLDSAGWVAVKELLAGCARSGLPIDRTRLDEIVRDSDKKRFALSAGGTRIRANQGHSVEVQLDYSARTPPAVLYHGTASRFLDSIRERGLLRGERHHVHLSADAETAKKVGARHGRAVVLNVAAGAMHEADHRFFRSDNGVWLVNTVPVEHLVFPDRVT